MSLSRLSMVVSRQAVSAARRQASTASEGVFRNQTVADEGFMFKPSTWFRYVELIPLIGCISFAGVLCGGYITYSFFKEDVRVNNSTTVAPWEKFSHDHMTKFLRPTKRTNQVPPEIVELKNQLGPYEVHAKH